MRLIEQVVFTMARAPEIPCPTGCPGELAYIITCENGDVVGCCNSLRCMEMTAAVAVLRDLRYRGL